MGKISSFSQPEKSRARKGLRGKILLPGRGRKGTRKCQENCEGTQNFSPEDESRKDPEQDTDHSRQVLYGLEFPTCGLMHEFFEFLVRK